LLRSKLRIESRERVVHGVLCKLWRPGGRQVLCEMWYAMGVAVPPPGATSGPAATGMTDNAASALCYVLGLITGILFLVLAPYNQKKSIRFHAFQSIFLSIAWIVVSMVINIVFGALHMWSLLFLSPLIGLAFFILGSI